MALIYLRHPLHGEKAESNDLITYLDKRAGWVEFDPVQEAADKAASEPEKKPKKAKAELAADVMDFFKVTPPTP